MPYNPETGTPLPEVDVAYRHPILLNVPDCFKNGTPLLDCNIRYHWFWRDSDSEAEKIREAKRWRTLGDKIDKAMKYAIRNRTVHEGDILLPAEFDKVFGASLASEVHGNNPPGGVEIIIVSSSLPNGYAYRLWTGHTAGDDPTDARVQEGTSGKRMVSSSDMRSAVPWGK
jgi:hypothetical protein